MKDLLIKSTAGRTEVKFNYKFNSTDYFLVFIGIACVYLSVLGITSETDIQTKIFSFLFGVLGVGLVLFMVQFWLVNYRTLIIVKSENVFVLDKVYSQKNIPASEVKGIIIDSTTLRGSTVSKFIQGPDYKTGEILFLMRNGKEISILPMPSAQANSDKSVAELNRKSKSIAKKLGKLTGLKIIRA
ncbi:hypothetical protein [Persicobacter diffluens]|uniref:Uncharacterized protein n=1 Tax=Persicobacter diffluens TaxID=981 RepID=A0AAN4W3G4_9BACT|nr:hypothetical protein PEDI_55080 [Persicobacter diffluens]